MFVSVHAAAGGTIGLFAQNPISAFFWGFLSHFLLDLIPHGDEKIFQKIFLNRQNTIKCFLMFFLDALGTIFLTFFFFQNFFEHFGNLFFGIIGGILPDCLQTISFLSKGKLFKKFAQLHDGLHSPHRKYNLPLAYGMLIQINILAYLLFFIFF